MNVPAVKIVLVVGVFPQQSETFIVNKFLGLLAAGFDVHIVCRRFDDEAWKRFSQLKTRNDARMRVHSRWPVNSRWLAAALIPVAVLHALANNPTGTARYLLLALRQFGFAAAVRKFYDDAVLVAVRPNLIHFEFGTLAVDHMYLREFLNAAVLVSFRGFDLNFAGLDYPNFYRSVWDNADAIHCLGEDLWQRARRRGCPAGMRKRLIPPAIDSVVFRRKLPKDRGLIGRSDRPARILSVGRLEWKKGHEFALQMIEILIRRGLSVEYRIVGEGDYFEAVAFCREQLGLRNAVHLLGRRTAEEVREQMEWADVFVHLAVSEGFCNSVLEAQAMELPVVVSDADGLAENVVHEKSGFIVPRRDPSSAADRIFQLANDGVLRSEMGRAGRLRVVQKFKLEDQIKAFARFYHEILAHGSPAYSFGEASEAQLQGASEVKHDVS